MAFDIRLTERAGTDLDMIIGFLKEEAGTDVARVWLAGILESIRTLCEMPARCAVAPEAEEIGVEVRVLFHGKKNHPYRVYFQIRPTGATAGSVQVLHVRHWARRPLTNDELDELMSDQEDGGYEGAFRT